MAYTRTPWDPAVPSGASQVSAGDNEIRAIKQDLLERLESFFEDIDADPLVPKDTAIDALTAISGKKLMIQPSMLRFTDEEDEWGLDDNRIGFDVGGPAGRAPIDLPPGTHIKNLKAIVERVTATSFTIKIKSVTADTSATAADVFTGTETDAGVQQLDSGAIDIEIEDDKYYFLQVDPNDTGRFYCAVITYDSPGLSAVR